MADEDEGTQMQAAMGDRLIIKSHRVGETDRAAEILEIEGDNGAPPFRVRWEEDGHEGLVFPGADAVVEHTTRKAAKH